MSAVPGVLRSRKAPGPARLRRVTFGCGGIGRRIARSMRRTRSAVNATHECRVGSNPTTGAIRPRARPISIPAHLRPGMTRAERTAALAPPPPQVHLPPVMRREFLIALAISLAVLAGGLVVYQWTAAQTLKVAV